MKPIHEIIDKIRWNKNENMDDYVVGYWDRVDENIVETGLGEFLEQNIPYHRIRYLKKKGRVVWKR